jgi:hypothetical protein
MGSRGGRSADRQRHRVCDQERAALSRSWPAQTIDNQFVRWSRVGVFNKIFTELVGKGGKLQRTCLTPRI